MTESKMQKLDAKVEPLVDECLVLLRRIEKKLPCGGVTRYKKSPVRATSAALNHLRKAAAFLEGIQ